MCSNIVLHNNWNNLYISWYTGYKEIKMMRVWNGSVTEIWSGAANKNGWMLNNWAFIDGSRMTIAKITTKINHLQLSCLYESTNIYSGITNYHQKFRIRKISKECMNEIGKWSFVFIHFHERFLCVYVRLFSIYAIVQLG